MMVEEVIAELGPLQIDYIDLYNASGGAGFLSLLLFLIWASYLVHLCKYMSIWYKLY